MEVSLAHQGNRLSRRREWLRVRFGRTVYSHSKSEPGAVVGPYAWPSTATRKVYCETRTLHCQSSSNRIDDPPSWQLQKRDAHHVKNKIGRKMRRQQHEVLDDANCNDDRKRWRVGRCCGDRRPYELDAKRNGRDCSHSAGNKQQPEKAPRESRTLLRGVRHNRDYL